jgi:Cu+-exporting ATPase
VSAAVSQHLQLPIQGMTCASCAVRIEKKLNRVEGVSATVNFATETATVDYDPAQASPEALVGVVEGAGYQAALRAPAGAVRDDHARDPVRDLRRRLVVSALLSLPVLALAMVPALQFDSWQWLSLQLATPVVLWGAWPFHRAALLNLRHGTATMDTLISVGVLAAWGWSVYALFFLDAGNPDMRMDFVLSLGLRGDADIYLEVGAVVTTLILLGRFLEARAKSRAGAALRALLELGAKDAHVLRDGVEVVVPVDELRVGDRFVVRPGEKVATDGVVEDGASAVDQSILTGESVPVEVVPGFEVAGGTISTSGRLVVRATRVGADTALAQIGRLVAEAQAGKAPVQRLADQVSAVFVPIVIALAVGTLGFWLGAGADTEFAIAAAVSVLIIACPCALGLATPTALMVGTGRGAQMGILIKGPEVLERTRRITTVVLDKTGTVTEGRMTLAHVRPGPTVTAQELLRVAGAVEEASEHPVGRAIARRAGDELGRLPDVNRFANTTGFGVSGFVEGKAVVIGRPELLEEWGLDLGPTLEQERTALELGGRTVVAVAWNGRVRGLLGVGDRMKSTSADAVADLKRLGLTPVLLTGDNEYTAHAVAEQVGIERVLANVRPDGKVAEVRRLQEAGEVVAVVGDGVNDAPALAQADLGLAIGTGTDVAIEASDLTLVSGDLRAAGDAIRLARRTLRTIYGNLFWAFAYNVAAIPLAVAGLLNPIVAAAAMAFSSVFVVTNSLRLRGFRSRREVT